MKDGQRTTKHKLQITINTTQNTKNDEHHELHKKFGLNQMLAKGKQFLFFL